VRRRRSIGPLVLTAPATIGLLLFFVAPLVAFGVYSFLTGTLYDVEAPLTLDNYRTVVETDINRRLARNSLVVGVLAAFFSVLIALPMAYWLRYSAGRWRGIVLFLIVASFLASYLVRIFAWRSMLGRNGAINRGLEGIGVIDEPLDFLLYNRFAVTVALVHIFLPYVVLVLYAGLAPLQPSYLETAQDLGAGRLQRWRKVVLPLVAAPAVSAFLFVFVLSAADYVTPQLLGGTSGIMLGVQVQVAFIGTGDFAYGAAMAFAMLAGFLVLYALLALALRLTRLDRVRFAA
jgi:spermidine/putrescine transport system permease protein